MSLKRRMQLIHNEEESIIVESGLKVAFATTDLKHVDQHFGSAKSLAIYFVTEEAAEFSEVVQFGNLSQDGNEDKLAEKRRILEGCSVVYCQAIGASAVKQLIAIGVQPIKVHEGSDITQLLDDLKEELRSGPSSWLARAIKQQQGANPDRFNEMLEEDWSE